MLVNIFLGDCFERVHSERRNKTLNYRRLSTEHRYESSVGLPLSLLIRPDGLELLPEIAGWVVAKAHNFQLFKLSTNSTKKLFCSTEREFTHGVADV